MEQSSQDDDWGNLSLCVAGMVNAETTVSGSHFLRL
jgi:hypothetical protein